MGSDTIDDVMNGWGEEATDENSRAKKSKGDAYRAAHEDSHTAVQMACDKMAVTRRHLEKLCGDFFAIGRESETHGPPGLGASDTDGGELDY